MIDPLTKKEFTPNRSNQKFETRENQIRYNNIKAAKVRKEKSEADKPLHRNRIILSNILGPNREVVVSEDFLRGAGFSFGYITHSVKIQNGTLVWCIYKMILQKLENKNYKIYRNE